MRLGVWVATPLITTALMGGLIWLSRQSFHLLDGFSITDVVADGLVLTAYRGLSAGTVELDGEFESEFADFAKNTLMLSGTQLARGVLRQETGSGFYQSLAFTSLIFKIDLLNLNF